jgi:hypothetical protein
MIPIRPSFDGTIEAMRSLSTDTRVRAEVRDDPELLDLLVTAEYVNFDHQSTADDYSTRHGWGKCETCETQWPCVTWRTTESAILEWMVKSSTSLIARYR